MVTVGSVSYCSRCVLVKKFGVYDKYKGDCHSHAALLLIKRDMLIVDFEHKSGTTEKEGY